MTISTTTKTEAAAATVRTTKLSAASTRGPVITTHAPAGTMNNVRLQPIARQSERLKIEGGIRVCAGSGGDRYFSISITAGASAASPRTKSGDASVAGLGSPGSFFVQAIGSHKLTMKGADAVDGRLLLRLLYGQWQPRSPSHPMRSTG